MIKNFLKFIGRQISASTGAFFGASFGSTFLCLASLTLLSHCKNKTFQSKYSRDIFKPPSESFQHPSDPTGTVHSRRYQPRESYEPWETESPTQIVPVSNDLEENIKKSLDKQVPKGPDCNSEGTPKTADCLREGSDTHLSARLVEWIVPIAYAAASPGLGLPDKTFTQSQLLSLISKQSPLFETYSKISKVHFYFDGSDTFGSPFKFLITTPKNQELVGFGDSDWNQSCRVIETVFPKDSKEWFQAISESDGASVSLQSPTRGRVCSKNVLSGYRILNLYSAAQKNQKKVTPSLVMLISKEPGRLPSYILRNRFKDRSDYFSDFTETLGIQVDRMTEKEAQL